MIKASVTAVPASGVGPFALRCRAGDRAPAGQGGGLAGKGWGHLGGVGG
jgi:hypothetical protein